jgi:hypothetical protein
LIFLLSEEVLLEADHNEFQVRTFSFFSLDPSSLGVIYLREGTVRIKTQKRFLVFLLSVEALLGANPDLF